MRIRGVAGTARRRGGSRRRSWRDSFDVDSFVAEVIEYVAPRLGLDYIGVGDRELAAVLRPIIEDMIESRSTKPKAETIASRIEKMKPVIYKALASMLLEREELSPEQIEFIVAHAEDLAGKAAPLLYRHAVKYGLDHVVEALRVLWSRYGRPLPLRCPRCGFYALAPNLECMVCGSSISERELKDSIGFRDRLRDYAGSADWRLVEEIIHAGYIYFDGEIRPPSMRPSNGYYIALYLSREERELLRSLRRG